MRRTARPGGGLADRLAARFVTLSGVVIIAAILAILFVIVAVVWPLFVPPSARRVPAGSLPDGTVPLALAVDEYREEAFVATGKGLVLLPVAGGAVTAAELPALGEATVVEAVAPEPELSSSASPTAGSTPSTSRRR